MQYQGFVRLFASTAAVTLWTLGAPGCAGQVVPDPGESGSSIGWNEQPSEVNRGYGLTFATVSDPRLGPGEVHMSCHAERQSNLSRVDQAWRDSCNPYVGDTSCSRARPILCVRMDGTPEPQQLTFDFYNGWVPGVLASTSPIVGTRLTSRAAADAFCERELGEGFRMAAFHDANGNGGWTFTGKRGQVNEQERNWVYIDDQPGNCWNAARR